MADKKKVIFGEPETWNNSDGSRMTVDQFLEAQNDYNNDPKFLDALVNTPYLDMPLNALNPKAIEDRQIKIDAKRELDKDLKQIRDNPAEYVQSKIDLYLPEDQENLNYLKNLANKKQKVASDENLKKNINTARAMEILPEPKKALDQGLKKSKPKTTWQVMLEGADPKDRIAYQKILNREYYKRGTKNLSDYELKFIGKHPSQLSPKVEEIKPVVKVKSVVTPEEPLEVLIKRSADERLRKQQEAYDRQYGTQGIVSLKRPI